MDREPLEQRLSKISTAWTVLEQAHGAQPEVVASARELLARRYGGAVYRYLLAALRDPHAAEDLTQEFTLALVRGDFRHVKPERGRFRGYVKTVLFHLVSRHRRQQHRQPSALDPDAPGPVDPATEPPAADEAFRLAWREELLARAWEALIRTQPTYHEVLRFRSDHPDLHSPQLAAELTRRLGKSFTPDSFRQTLHRARAVFADLLVEEVAQSLRTPTAPELEEELRELDLLAYCRPALERKRGRKSS